MPFCIAAAFLSILFSAGAVYHGIRPGEPDQIGSNRHTFDREGAVGHIKADKTGRADVVQRPDAPVEVMGFRHKAAETSGRAPSARVVAVRAPASRRTRQ
jgi:hypothetical protein